MRYLSPAISLTSLMLLSSGSFAAKYNYEVVLDDVTFGQYASEMRTLSGFIETSEPIPPNENQLDISSIVIGWSFSDGVISLTDENSVIVGEDIVTPDGQGDDVPLVTTDSEGNIIQARIILIEAPATTIGEETNSVQIAGYFPFPLFPDPNGVTFTSSGEIRCFMVVPGSLCYAYEFGDSWGATVGIVGWTTDTDGDGVVDGLDNCPSVANADDEFGDACVDPSAAVNDGVELGEGVVLEEGVSVAKDSSLGDDVEVGENTAIGKGTSIGMDTTVGEDSSVRKETELGTDVTIGNNVTIAKGVLIGANVAIEDNVVIRKDVTISDNVTIGEGALIDQAAIVLNSVPAGAVIGKRETF